MSSRSTGNPPETDFQWWSFLRKSWSDHFGSGKLSSFDTNLKTLIWQKQFCHSWSLESLFEAFDDYTFDKAVEKRVIGNYVTFDHSNTFFITTWGLFRVFLNNVSLHFRQAPWLVWYLSFGIMHVCQTLKERKSDLLKSTYVWQKDLLTANLQTSVNYFCQNPQI